MTVETIKTRLIANGAMEHEADLLAEIMHINGWFGRSAFKPSNR